jgi:hypothetical protein
LHQTFYEEPRPDAGEELERSFGPFVTEEQHVNVFSTDFRKLAAAAEALTASVAVDLEAAIDNLDLLFRWLVLRMVEANTTSLLKSFELLDKLLEALRGVGYRLSETEAALLLPTLLDKSGHNIVQVRDNLARHLQTLIPIAVDLCQSSVRFCLDKLYALVGVGPVSPATLLWVPSRCLCVCLCPCVASSGAVY